MSFAAAFLSPFVSMSTLRMWARSFSWTTALRFVATGAPFASPVTRIFSGRCSRITNPPSLRATILSMAFSSSRTFPGQS